VLESTLLSLRPPSSRALHAFRNVFNNKATDPSGDGFPTLGGRSAAIYDEKNDLMGLGNLNEEDRLTALIRYSCPWLFVVCMKIAVQINLSEAQALTSNSTTLETTY